MKYDFHDKNIGIALTGSYCTYEKTFIALQRLKETNANLYTIFSKNASKTNSRFGNSKDFLDLATSITGKAPIITIPDAEPIGPKSMLDILVIAPCTGNTLSTKDRPFVDIMKEHIKSKHIYLECDNESQADYLYKAVDARDLPCMADVESSLLYFCSLFAKNVRVALTGECADEIFGGYPWFGKPLPKDNFPWSMDFDTRNFLLKDDIVRELNLEEYSKNVYLNCINEAPLLTSDAASEASAKKLSYVNLKYFMSTLLNRMDRTSMYSGLEARVPFADIRLLEYVYNLPEDYKYHDGIVKSLLVDVGKDYLPTDVLHRKKSPYPKTYDKNYEKLLICRLQDVCSDPNSPLLDFVDINKLKYFMNSPMDYGKPWYGQLMAGPQMLGYLLQIDYWLRKCPY